MRSFILLLLASICCLAQQPRLPVRKQTYLNPSFEKPTVIGNIATSEGGNSLVGLSGVARPTVAANSAYIWMVNDNVGLTGVLAFDKATLAFSGTWTLQGVTRVDFEDLGSASINGTSYLYVADFGNNSNTADSRGAGVDFKIYRCIEPTVTGSAGTLLSGNIETISCAFPSPGAGNDPTFRDCETLLVDKETGDMYFITKRVYPARCYKLAHATSYAGTQTVVLQGKVATDTSPTSKSIGTGDQTFTTDRGLEFPIGMRLRAQSRASAPTPTNWMEGPVIARSGNSLTIRVEVNTPTLTDAVTSGSGVNLTDWDISLPQSKTQVAQNGNATGGAISPKNDEVAICSYSNLYIFPRSHRESIFATISKAPSVGARVPGNDWTRSDSTLLPSLVQGEGIEYYDTDGNALFQISEFNAARGSVNPMYRNTRSSKPATTVRLPSTSDTYIDSTVPGTSQATAVSLVSDINWQAATTYSAVANNGGKAQFTVLSATGFAVGLKVLITTQSAGTNYIGTWATTAVSGTSITLDVPFTANVTGAIQTHTQDRDSLVKFDISSIPAGSTIIDAYMRVFINTEGESFAVYRMKTTWADSDTFTTIGPIAPDANVKANSTADHVTQSGMATYVGFWDWPVPVATIQGWLDGTFSNFGWLIVERQGDTGGNGFQWDSLNSATASRQPILYVTYK